MSEFRFEVGTTVMCNLGQLGWRLGRVIALNYREENWPEGRIAPYQVALDEDYSLIYVPKDNDRFCRKATNEDVKILARGDALAELHVGIKNTTDSNNNSTVNPNLCCDKTSASPPQQSYRKGRCFCCNDCPKDWSYAELYSEHYRCAERNNVKVTQHKIKLGTVNVGDSISQKTDDFLLGKSGFMQAPTLARLPPGIIFSDDGTLSGEVRYDPHRGARYDVDFVAVSTSEWNDDSVGLIRLEIHFTVDANQAPSDFDSTAFAKVEEDARSQAAKLLNNLNETWAAWENRSLGNKETCQGMLEDLNRLRTLAEAHPRLDNGKWWGHLGGYHMNVHKLLENTLFECELYLGYALTFGDDDVRFYAEQNLNGCYQKRLLETARFMWYDGIELMLQSEWTAAIETFRPAYAKKEGWGWAVNYGDIWLSEAVAMMIQGAESASNSTNGNEVKWIDKASKLIKKALSRATESGVFGPEGHPWISEVNTALESYKQLISAGQDRSEWLQELKSRTIYWCSQVLAGVFPFPPQARLRLASESDLIANLPGHNQ